MKFGQIFVSCELESVSTLAEVACCIRLQSALLSEGKTSMPNSD